MDHPAVLSLMYRSRFFEEKVEEAGNKGLIHGTYHLAIGQEGCHIGLSSALDRADWIVPTHRCHGYNVGRGSDLFRMFSEMLGSRHGLCMGIGGSMHMTDVSASNFGSSAVVGSGISLAGGIAYAFREQGKTAISVAIFGDGASSRGTLHEMMNMASVFHLPMLFFLENNHYGMSASSAKMISTDRIWKRADGYSMESAAVDGNDVIAVSNAVREARAFILRERRPFFIEADTYRMRGHSRSDKCVYRTREEEDEWLHRDPIEQYASFLVSLEIMDEEEISRIACEERKAVDEAFDKALAYKDDTITVPEMKRLIVSGSRGRFSNGRTMHRGSYREAIREALDEALESDSHIRIIGEDVGAYGGCFGVTGNLFSKYPDRFLETPVSEETFTGMAAGAAAMGLHPCVEVMYGDFSTLASDALINHAAKLRFMSAGQLQCPMVYRTPIGGGTGHGPQHTQSLETMFLGVPGLYAVAPSDPFSAKALLKSALLIDDPVLFFEHKALYGEMGEIGDTEAFIPIGKAIVHGSGGSLLAIGYSRAFRIMQESLSDISDEITFIDLATIHPLDEETLKREFLRIGKAMIVQEPSLGGSVAESVLRVLSEAGEVYGKVRIITSEAMPVPSSRIPESNVIISGESIRKAAEELLMR